MLLNTRRTGFAGLAPTRRPRVLGPRHFDSNSGHAYALANSTDDDDEGYSGKGARKVGALSKQQQACWPYTFSWAFNLTGLILLGAFVIFAFVYTGVQYNQSSDPANTTSTGTNPLFGHMTFYLGDSRQFSVTWKIAWVVPSVGLALLLLLIGNAVTNGMRYGASAADVAAFVSRGPGHWNNWLVGLAVVSFSTISFLAFNISGTTDIATLLLYSLIGGLVPVVCFMIQHSRNSSFRTAYSEWALAKATARGLQQFQGSGAINYSEQTIVDLLNNAGQQSASRGSWAKLNKHGQAVVLNSLDEDVMEEAVAMMDELRGVNDAITANVPTPKDVFASSPPASIYAKGNSGIKMYGAILVVLLAFAVTICAFSLAHQWENLRRAQQALVCLNLIFHGMLAVVSVIIGMWGVGDGKPLDYHPFHIVNLFIVMAYVLTMLPLSYGAFGYDGEFKGTN